MSESILLPTDDEPESFAIVRIMADRTRGLEALAAASADNLDPATLRTRYNNAIQLARALNASENLTERFATIETLTNERDAATTDLNTATTQLTQLRTQLTQTLALATAATTNGGGQTGGRKGQTDPERFTGEDRHKLRSFIALLRLRLIDRPGEFSDEQSKLHYAFSRLEGAALEQLIHLVDNDHVDLDNFDAFVTSLEEAYGDPDHANTAERALSKLRQGNRDFVSYYAEFQRLIADLQWKDAAKRAALHRGLSEELKDILSTQDLPEDWSGYVAHIKKRDMQFRARRAETHRPSGPNKANAGPVPRVIPHAAAPPTPHPTNNSSGNFGPTPMDLSAARRRLSHEERQKRIDEGRCLYCGGFHHLARDCPNKTRDPGRPLQGAVAEATIAPEAPPTPIMEPGKE
jgi:hypothetical protein